MWQAVTQLGRLYESLGALREQVEPVNGRNFTILAEGHLEEIRRIQKELDEYAGTVKSRKRPRRGLRRTAQ
jgi:hypothetical protein